MSPYDGRSRRVLWIGLGLVCAAQLVGLADSIQERAGWSPSLVALAAGGLVALDWFAFGHSAIAGALGLGALALLEAKDFALTHEHRRHQFACGVALLGWLAGLGYARARGRSSDGDGEDSGEALAESGAVAALAATYVVAALSKLGGGGLEWADALTLRTTLLAERPVDGAGPLAACARAVVEHPLLARALSWATLGIQLGAIGLPFDRRFRRVWGTLILAFHLQVALLAGLGYWGAFCLILLFSYPLARRQKPAAGA